MFNFEGIKIVDILLVKEMIDEKNSWGNKMLISWLMGIFFR